MCLDYSRRSLNVKIKVNSLENSLAQRNVVKKHEIYMAHVNSFNILNLVDAIAVNLKEMNSIKKLI